MNEPTIGVSGSASFLRAAFLSHIFLLLLPLVQADQFLWALGRMQSFIVGLTVTNLIAMAFVLLCAISYRRVVGAQSNPAARRWVWWTTMLLVVMYGLLAIGAASLLWDEETRAIGRIFAFMGLMGLPLGVAMIIACRRLQLSDTPSAGSFWAILGFAIAVPALIGSMGIHYMSFRSAQQVHDQFLCELNMKQTGTVLMMMVDAGGLPRQLDTPELYRVLGHTDSRYLSCPCDPTRRFAYLPEEVSLAEGVQPVPSQDRVRVALLWDREARHGGKLNVLVADIAFVERAEGGGRVTRLVEHLPQRMTPDELQMMLTQVRPLLPLLITPADQ